MPRDLDQSLGAQITEMLGNLDLRLAQNFLKVADAEGAVGEIWRSRSRVSSQKHW